MLSESDCYRVCRSVEDILIRSCKFLLPGKKAFLKSDVEYELILLDPSEKQIEGTKKVGKKKRLKKNRNNKQKHFYPREKKHTLKSQTIVDKRSRKVIYTPFGNGKKHDFKVFKESKVPWTEKTCGVTHSRYTGIKKLQKNSRLPKKWISIEIEENDSDYALTLSLEFTILSSQVNYARGLFLFFNF